jgi:hypothetical protein
MFKGIKRCIFNWLMPWLMSVVAEEEHCDCEDCGGEQSITQSMTDYTSSPIDEELIENWNPPARYCVRTAGFDYWVDRFEPGPVSLDLFWMQKIDGKDRTVRATLSEMSFAIVDYGTSLNSGAFDPMHESDIEPAQEAEDPYEAKMRIDRKPSVPLDSNVMLSYA